MLENGSPCARRASILGDVTTIQTEIAGIPIPDSMLAREATEFVHDVSTQLLFDHAAHFHQATSDDLQLCVVLFRDVPTQLMHLHCLAELY